MIIEDVRFNFQVYYIANLKKNFFEIVLRQRIQFIIIIFN